MKEAMELKLEIYGYLCATCVFSVNGIAANKDDFGSQYDNDKENAEDYGCGDMKFERREYTQEVLDKYNITVDQYYEIASKLEEGLSFGRCGWCI